MKEGTGLQVAAQLALNDVAHGTVVRQTDEGGCVHEAGAAEEQSHAMPLAWALHTWSFSLPPRRPSTGTSQQSRLGCSICLLGTV